MSTRIDRERDDAKPATLCELVREGKTLAELVREGKTLRELSQTNTTEGEDQ